MLTCTFSNVPLVEAFGPLVVVLASGIVVTSPALPVDMSMTGRVQVSDKHITFSVQIE